MPTPGSLRSLLSLSRHRRWVLLLWLGSSLFCSEGAEIGLPLRWQAYDLIQGDVEGWNAVEPPPQSGVLSWPLVSMPVATSPTPAMTRTNLWNSSGAVLSSTLIRSTPVHYFRTSFSNPIQGTPKALQLLFGARDGAAFYLNGQEIARWNLPEGELHPSSRALTPEVPVDFHAVVAASAALVPGSNVLAVALYSSDPATTNNAGYLAVRLSSLNPGYLFFQERFTNQVRWAGDSVTVLGTALADQPVHYQWYRDQQLVPGKTDPKLSFESLTASDAGFYSLVAANDEGKTATNSFGITVLSPDRPGSIDFSFHSPTGLEAVVRACVVMPDDRIVLGGTFPKVPGTAAGGIVRLMPDGALDPTFHPPDLSSGVYSLLPLSDGSLIVGGRFQYDFGQSSNAIGILKLQPDGTPDPGFIVKATPVGTRVMVLENGPGDTIYTGGEFTQINETPTPGIARLLPDGRADPTFKPQGKISTKRALLPMPDGNVLAAMFGESIPPQPLLVLYRPDGSTDPSFAPPIRPRGGSFYGPVVGTLGFDDHLNVYAAGWFESFGSVVRSNVVRLLPNGNIDPTFNAGVAEDAFPYHIHGLPDGDFLLTGDFFHFNKALAGGMVRVRNDGNVDRSFILGTALFSSVVADSATGMQLDPSIYGVAFQSDGRMILAGFFSSYLQYPVRNVLRAYMPVSAPKLRLDKAANGELLASWPVAGPRMVLQSSDELGSPFIAVPNAPPPVAHGGRWFQQQPAAAHTKFYRLASP